MGADGTAVFGALSPSGGRGTPKGRWGADGSSSSGHLKLHTRADGILQEFGHPGNSSGTRQKKEGKKSVILGKSQNFQKIPNSTLDPNPL